MTDNRPDNDPAAKFHAALVKLYQRIGSPPYRQLIRAAAQPGLGISTIGDLLTGGSVPRWSTVSAFLDLCRRYARRKGLIVGDAEFDLERWRGDYDLMRVAEDRHRAKGQPPRRHWVGVVPAVAGCFQPRGAVDAEAVLALGTTSVLSGLGGVGKTQLAAELARKAWRAGQVNLLVWVTATDRDSILSAYADALSQVTGADVVGLEHAAGRFLTWLIGTDLRWLIVLDDLADPGDLNGLWPPVTEANDGRALITTRRRDAALADRLIEVGLFTPDEAVAYLQAKLVDHHQLAVGVPALAEALGYHPLALAQATTYLIDRGLTTDAYRERYADRRRRLTDLLPEPGALPDDQSAPVAATWSLSIERADSLNPAGLARPLLELTAFLDPHAIPEQVFTSDPALGYLCAARTQGGNAPVNADDGRDAVRSLNRLNLVEVDGPQGTAVVRVHALVQRATRDLMVEDRTGPAVTAVANALVTMWPEVERDQRLAKLLRANAAALTAHDPLALWAGAVHPLLRRLGDSIGGIGRIKTALEHFRRLCDLAVNRLGPDNPDTLRVRHDLSYWRGQGGDYTAASIEAKEVIDDYRRVLGSNHPDTLAATVYLQRWLGMTGKPELSATSLRELIPVLTRVLGPDHNMTLTARNDQAYFKGVAGDPAGASTLFADLLADRTRLLGPDHPHTLTTRNDLYVCVGQAGDAEAATEGFARLVPALAKVLGPDHPHTLAARGNRARWRGQAGDPGTAVAELTDLVLDFQRVIGPDHPFTLRTHQYLAEWQQRATEDTPLQ